MGCSSCDDELARAREALGLQGAQYRSVLARCAAARKELEDENMTLLIALAGAIKIIRASTMPPESELTNRLSLIEQVFEVYGQIRSS